METKNRKIVGVDVGVRTGIAVYDYTEDKIVDTFTVSDRVKFIEFFKDLMAVEQLSFIAVEYPNPIALSKYRVEINTIKTAVEKIATLYEVPLIEITPGEWKTSTYKKWFKKSPSPHENDAACIAKYSYMRQLRRDEFYE